MFILFVPKQWGASCCLVWRTPYPPGREQGAWVGGSEAKEKVCTQNRAEISGPFNRFCF